MVVISLTMTKALRTTARPMKLLRSLELFLVMFSGLALLKMKPKETIIRLTKKIRAMIKKMTSMMLKPPWVRISAMEGLLVENSVAGLYRVEMSTFFMRFIVTREDPKC